MAKRVASDQLNDRQLKFAREYALSGNATQAAIAAGYSAKSATVEGSRQLAKAKVSQYIDDLKAADAKKFGITADKVRQHLAACAFFDPRKLYRPDGSMKPVHEWDDETAAAIIGIESEESVLNEAKQSEMDLGDGPDYIERVVTRKIKWTNKVNALSLAAEMLGLKRAQTPTDSGGLSITFVPHSGR